jgi:hypothetical protein
MASAARAIRKAASVGATTARPMPLGCGAMVRLFTIDMAKGLSKNARAPVGRSSG